MNLSLLILLPFLTAIVLLFCTGLKQIRTVSLLGSAAQLLLSFNLLFLYLKERSAGNLSQMLFESNFV